MRFYAQPIGMVSPFEAAVMALLRDQPKTVADLVPDLDALLSSEEHPVETNRATLRVAIQRLRDEGFAISNPAPPFILGTHELTDAGRDHLDWCLGFWESLSQ